MFEAYHKCVCNFIHLDLMLYMIKVHRFWEVE